MAETKIDKLEAALVSLIDKKRIVFWYDEGAEMKDFVDNLQIPEVKILKLEGNPFTVKYNILKGNQPARGFIIYSNNPKPVDEDNWLLDLELSGAVFSADVATIYATETNIPIEYKDRIINKYIGFFKNGENRKKLAKQLTQGMSVENIFKKIVEITSKTQPDIESITLVLAKDAIGGKSDLIDKLEKYNLISWYWKNVKEIFGYNGAENIKDLLIVLFREDMEHNYLSATLKNEAFIFMRDWRDSRSYGDIYKLWADNIEKDLNIVSILENRNFDELLRIDTFPIVDKLIAVHLKMDVENKVITSSQIENIIDIRENKLFSGFTQNTLMAFLQARKLMETIDKFSGELNFNNIEEAFKKYENELYKIDSIYRQYFKAAANSEMKNMLTNITPEVERVYSNSWLNELARKWQPFVDAMPKWNFGNFMVHQNRFFHTYVTPFIEKKKKVFVIISDALRYETMVELSERIGAINRMETDMKPAMVSMLPSYTQLGMAALLPNKELSYEKNQDEVFADGQSTKGTENRQKILQKAVNRSVVYIVKDFLEITNSKSAFKHYDLIYIYSNKIDFTGDKRETEKEVFKATEDEINQIIKMIEIIRNGNGTNILITSDHGYLYQNEELDETEFVDFKPQGDIITDTRRFVIGNNLKGGDAVRTWESEAVGLKEGRTIQIAKAMNRMKKQGAGARFVHGGSMPQEIVIPVLHVNIKKPMDISQVDVDVLNTRSRITTNRQTINFYQNEAVTEKLKPSIIKAGFYDTNDNLISDSVILKFDNKDEDGASREQKHIFIFRNQLSSLNGKEITLKMERQILNSEQFSPYKEYPFKVSVMFADEF